MEKETKEELIRKPDLNQMLILSERIGYDKARLKQLKDMKKLMDIVYRFIAGFAIGIFIILGEYLAAIIVLIFVITFELLLNILREVMEDNHKKCQRKEKEKPQSK